MLINSSSNFSAPTIGQVLDLNNAVGLCVLAIAFSFITTFPIHGISGKFSKEDCKESCKFRHCFVICSFILSVKGSSSFPPPPLLLLL